MLPKPGDGLSHYKRTACTLSTSYQCPYNHQKATVYHSSLSLTPPPATTLLVQPCAHRPRLPVAQQTRYAPPLCSTGFLKSLLTQRKHGKGTLTCSRISLHYNYNGTIQTGQYIKFPPARQQAPCSRSGHYPCRPMSHSCAERMNAFTACSSLGLITPAALEFPTYALRAGVSVRFVGVRALSYHLKLLHRRTVHNVPAGPPAPTQHPLLLRTRTSTLWPSQHRVTSSTTPPP